MNIYQKLIGVRKEVPYLQKENAGAQYKYVSSSQVLAGCKAKMDELGLLLIPAVIGHKVIESTVEQHEKDTGFVTKRTTTYFTELDMTMTWVNAENPEETIMCTWYGQGVDIAGEKGVGKAMTYAEKYFMLKFFNIPTDKDDPDSFQDKNGNGEPSGKRGKDNKRTPAGQKNTQPEPAQQTKAETGRPAIKNISDIQKVKIQELAKAVGKTGIDITALCKSTYKKQYSQLTEMEAGEVIATLQIEFDKRTAGPEPPSAPLLEIKQEDSFTGANMPEKTMKAIHARAAEIGMNHDDLRSYAQCQYPIKSLKDLNEEQGKALLADLRALPDLDKAVGA